LDVIVGQCANQLI
ncbi:hypothetical protein D039_2802B, partial [Vibrio parahaemolyticus EKP-028]